MPNFWRVQIYGFHANDPKKDKITNTVYFRDGNDIDPNPNMSAQELGDEVWAAFVAGVDKTMCGITHLGAKVYKMTDAAPRTPHYVKEQAVTVPAAGVREVALCLSFRGASNTARQRGRIFLGPFAPSQLGDLPTAGLTDAVAAFPQRLADVGGDTTRWCVHSPSEARLRGIPASYFPVEHCWVDNAWDTQRSRGVPPNGRRNIPVAG